MKGNAIFKDYAFCFEMNRLPNERLSSKFFENFFYVKTNLLALFSPSCKFSGVDCFSRMIFLTVSVMCLSTIYIFIPMLGL